MQETQLPPHRRNMQDLLCDSSMIPYPEPYQSMYQRRRLGALGIEWHPPSVKFAVGPADNINGGDYQFPLIDLDRWVEPVPEFLDAMDWDQENEVQSDDTDSEYDATEEFSSEGDGESAGVSSSADSECSAEESEGNHGSKEGLRRSKRKIQKTEVEVTTSSGRRVKRRNLDERDGTISKNHRTRRSRNGKPSKRKSSKSKSLRPQRRAARNALTLFSQINGASTDGEDEDVSETDSSDSEMMLQDSNTQSNESDHSILKSQVKQRKQKEVLVGECEDASKASQVTQPLVKKRLLLKLPVRNRKETPSGNDKIECHQEDYAALLSARALSNGTNLNGSYPGSSEQAQSSSHAVGQHELSSRYKGGTIKWGEVKTRSTKRLRLSESSAMDARHTQGSGVDVPNVVGCNSGGHLKSEHELRLPSFSEDQTDSAYRNDVNDQFAGDVSEDFVGARSEQPGPGLENESQPLSPDVLTQGATHPLACNGHGTTAQQPVHGEDLHGPGTKSDSNKPLDQGASAHDFVNYQVDRKPVYRRLKIKSSRLNDETCSPSSKLKSVAIDDWNSECDLVSDGPVKAEQNLISVAREADEGTSGQSPYNSDWNSGSARVETWEGKSTRLSASQDSDSYVDSYSKKYNAVYKRSNSSRGRKNLGDDVNHIQESTSNYDHHVTARNFNSVYYSTPLGTKDISNMSNGATQSGAEMSRTGGKSALNGCGQFLGDKWRSTSKMTVGLRSQRNRRENYSACDLSPLGKRKNLHPLKKTSWLLLSEHEEGYRYIPQLGDEVAYLRQGHEEYLKASHSREVGPWKKWGSLKAVELCRIIVLEYSTFPGSGESCCKLTLEFIDPSSCAFHRSFGLTLPELVAFPDFLVEKTRYDAAIERNWTHRDKCQVWWRNEDEGGSWWEGRIVAVKAKSPEFPDSPWERFFIQYKNDSSGQHPHSPWELHDADSQWEHPHVDGRRRETLLSAFAKLKQDSLKNGDLHGILRLNQAALKSEFMNRFPVPLSPEMIERRLENNYYRSLDAVKHDISVAVSNASVYSSKSAELSQKIQRLSNALARALASLEVKVAGSKELVALCRAYGRVEVRVLLHGLAKARLLVVQEGAALGGDLLAVEEVVA
ncbi:hypothetical protein Taro_023467 [Colocasia esculenta]|uniref:Bromo domain-containing protein n=1 Tax=Colocasia esculenta TaxID=4460 RepID=A0A843V8E6_COLES|nr:hypothetical protein [Colocasia esculenta]